MATISWTGASGNWNAGSLWSSDTVPGAADIAVIDAAGTYTVQLTDAETAAGVTLAASGATLHLDGSLALGGTLDVLAGTLDLTGALAGGTLALNGGSVVYAGSATLAGITVLGTIDLNTTGAALAVSGLSQAGSPAIAITGAGASLTVLDDATFDNETITLGAGNLIAAAGQTLTLGRNLVLQQDTPSTLATLAGAAPSPSPGTVVNEGTILVGAGALALGAGYGSNPLDLVYVPVVNTGVIDIAAGATLQVYGNGTIGTLGSVVNNGLLELLGTLDNSGSTLAIAAGGAFSNVLLNGLISGGTISNSDGTLDFANAATLAGATYQGSSLVFNQSFSGLALVNGTTLINPGGGAVTLALQGSGVIGLIDLLNGQTLSNTLISYGTTGDVLTINSNFGYVGVLAADTTIDVGAGDVLQIGVNSLGTLTDHAQINVGAGAALTIGGQPIDGNDGTIDLAAGAVVLLQGTHSLADLGTVIGGGGTLINAGVLDLQGGTLQLGGAGAFGAFNNLATLADGTVVAGAGTQVAETQTLDDVHFEGSFSIDAGAVISIANGLTMAGTDGTGHGTIDLTAAVGAAASVGLFPSATLLWENSETIDGADIFISGATSYTQGYTIEGWALLGVGAHVTLGHDVIINAVTDNGAISFLGGPGIYTSAATIDVAPGADFFITPYGTTTSVDFVNEGVITIEAGATLDISSNTSIVDLGTIVNNGGLLRLTDINGTQLHQVLPPYDNTGNTITIAPTGMYSDFVLEGVVLQGGTVDYQGGFIGFDNATLDGVTFLVPELHIASVFDLVTNAVQPGRLIVEGGTVVTDSVVIDSGGQLLFDQDQDFTNITISLGGQLSVTGRLGLDANTVVNVTGTNDFLSATSVVNAGTIILAPGSSLQLSDSTAISGPEPASHGTVLINGGTFSDFYLTGAQTIDITGGGVLTPPNRIDAGSLIQFTGAGTFQVGNFATIDAPVAGFGANDTIDLTGYFDGTFTGTAVPDLTLSYDGTTLNVLDNTTTVQSFDIGGGYVGSGFTITPSPLAPVLVTDFLITYEAPCFLAGTLIRTDRGEVPVQHLAVGDTVLTLRGEQRKIVWIGVGRALARRGRRGPATPLIVRQGALADNVPHHDLRVTKGHSLYLDGVLIPVEFLVNHRSILWDDVTQDVSIYHIELDTHDVLLANGAPAESYRDDGNRWLFQNANSGWHLPAKPPCAPLLTGGPVVDAIWRRLLDRAGARRGMPLTDEPDLHVMIDGRRIDASARDGMTYAFELPRPGGPVRIVSRSAVPAELGLARDPRELGVAVRCIVLRRSAWCRTIEACDPRLAAGFHDFEPTDGIRWTNGDAALPAALLAGATGALEMVLRLGGSTRYVDDGVSRLAA